ncbi:FAD-dependent oxidoreductase [Nocardia sp. CA-129566]|uniref:FAD-dependent oxidoreductase n=1 Tax=Nocardia sp. CA-129566 TaxID=3239976 RepID=UPI003D99400A
MNQTFDVVVAGAGPVGLILACELRLGGVDVLVVERLTEPDMTIKAGAINVPTAQAFYRRGLLPDLLEHQNAALERMRAAGTYLSPEVTPQRLPFAGLSRASCSRRPMSTSTTRLSPGSCGPAGTAPTTESMSTARCRVVSSRWNSTARPPTAPRR